MHKDVSTNKLLIAICVLFLVLGIIRFSISITHCTQRWSTDSIAMEAHMYDYGSGNHGNHAFIKWGPVFHLMAKTLLLFFTEADFSFVWRVILTISYLATICYIILIIFALAPPNTPRAVTIFWCCVITFFALQNTSAIYVITNSEGETLLALAIVVHFYYFLKKKYYVASFSIMLGIYFKFFPVVFAFPFVVFSLLSRYHKKYILAMIVAGITISVVSYFITGMDYGSLYPFTMVYVGLTKAAKIFNSAGNTESLSTSSLILKIAHGFIRLRGNETGLSYILQSIIPRAIAMAHIATTTFIGWRLSRQEKEWLNSPGKRDFQLFIFQVLTGFLFLLFSVDLSIERTICSILSIYSPIIFFSVFTRFENLSELVKIRGGMIFLLGISLHGSLVPVKIIHDLLFLTWIDRVLVGQTFDFGSAYGRYIWYQIPYIGIFFILLSAYYSLSPYIKIQKETI
jgi:hypothetical protein